jgi:type II secretory pathway pseudopilin PulG
VELLTVAVLIGLLVSLIISVARNAENRARGSRAKAEIAVLEMGLENFRADFGSYPTSGVVRVSSTYLAEATNSWLLYNALAGGGQTYVRLPVGVVRQPYKIESIAGWNFEMSFPVLVDPWGRTYNFYRTVPPLVTMTNVNPGGPNYFTGTLIGGQRNPASYDLWSYGADGRTYPGPNPGWMDWIPQGQWNAASSADDIANFNR